MFDGIFDNANDVFKHFDVSEEDQVGVHFVYACYEAEDYEGHAGVIFLKGGRFYIVTGSHCSCHGLEDQWDPEEITLEEIRHYRKNRKTPYGLDFDAVEEVVKRFDYLDTSVLTNEQIVMLLKLKMG